MFASCKDCGHEATTAADFSDHAHSCSTNPVPWEAYKEPEFPAPLPVKARTVEELLGTSEV